MDKILTAVFDGKVLHPDVVIDLEPNTRYVITVHDSPASERPTTLDSNGKDESKPSSLSAKPWDALAALVGLVKDAPPDWAVEHDHYLYGTPKIRGGALPIVFHLPS